MSQRPRLLTTSEGTSQAAYSLGDWGLFGGIGLIWGSSFYFIAVALQAFPPVIITPLRLALGFLALSLFPAARNRVERADLPRVALLGLTWMAVPLTMFPFAEERVTSALTGMLNGGMPIFAALVAWALLKRPPGRFQAVGLLVGLLGVVTIAAPTAGEGRSETIGVVMILFALLCYGLSVNLAVPLQQRYGALPVLWRAQMVALVLTIPFALPSLGEAHFKWSSTLAMAALGVLGTGVAYVLMGQLAGRVGATRAAVSTYLIPVVSVVLGTALLAERVHPLSLLGTAIVLAGAWLTSRRER
jgi:drug/metabolite transporter (DMT)-like permease